MNNQCDPQLNVKLMLGLLSCADKWRWYVVLLILMTTVCREISSNIQLWWECCYSYTVHVMRWRVCEDIITPMVYCFERTIRCRESHLIFELGSLWNVCWSKGGFPLSPKQCWTKILYSCRNRKIYDIEFCNSRLYHEIIGLFCRWRWSRIV
jgi:hypothetical protein